MVLDQIHVLEEPALCDVIVLHTVLNEVKHKSSLVYKKLLELCDDSSRRFYTFVNEHHKYVCWCRIIIIANICLNDPLLTKLSPSQGHLCGAHCR